MNFNLNRIPSLILACFLITIIIGFWKINLLLPLIFVFLIIAFRKKNLSFQFSILDIGFLCVLVSEIFAFIFSAYQFNSLPELTNFYVIFVLYILYKKLLKNVKYYNLFLSLVFSYSFLLLVITAIYFFLFKEKFNSQGFYELNDFKVFYQPLNNPNNIWVSVILLLVPFSAVFFYRQTERKFQILALINLCLLVFCVLASFSRGAYLSLMFFVLVFNIFSFRLFTIKKILILNSVCLMLFIAIALPIIKSTLTTVSFNKTLSQKRSTAGRLDRWGSNLENSLADKPYFGWGQKNYILAHSKKPYLKEDLKFSTLSNNTYLHVFLEKGFVGVLGYLVLFASIIIVIFKNLRAEYIDRFKKIQLILFFSGIVAFLVRELTFSSLFNNNTVYFLAFHLLFLLIPYDVEIKEIKISIKLKNSILILLLVVTSLLSYGSIQRVFVNKYNNESITSYYRNNIKNSLSSIDKALKLSPENITLNKHRTLILAKNSIDIEITKENKDFLSFVKINKDTLNLVKENLEKIIQISSYDDEVYHNAGWVYFALGEKDSAEIAFDNALQLNPYNSTFHLSKLLYNIKSANGKDIIDHLSKAIRYSPEIVESFFYIEFLKKYPDEAIEAKMKAIKGLREAIKKGNNIMLKARLARLILDEEPDKALSLLNEAIKKMPNLSRPWLYKGLIYFKKGDTLQSYRYYNTSLFINKRDFLARKYLSEYYKSIDNEEKHILNLDVSLLNLKNIRSDNVVKNADLSSLRPIHNSYIPFSLLKYQVPYIDEVIGLKLVKEYYRDK
tara:strand:+ start:3850 stop:6204 length:2355 start_codon:yes stop_codon:yes gene_type:complete